MEEMLYILPIAFTVMVLMIVVDVRRGYLNWGGEHSHEVVKRDENTSRFWGIVKTKAVICAIIAGGWFYCYSKLNAG